MKSSEMLKPLPAGVSARRDFTLSTFLFPEYSLEDNLMIPSPLLILPIKGEESFLENLIPRDPAAGYFISD